MLSLTQKQKQTQQQKLTPQQLQYLKLLQLSSVALEQRIKEELEINPLLEESEQTRSESEESADAQDEISWEDISPQDAYGSIGAAGRGGRDDSAPDLPQRAEQSLSERLLDQIRLQSVDENDLTLAEEIIGNIDSDGYLRRDLNELVEDLNRFVRRLPDQDSTGVADQDASDSATPAAENSELSESTDRTIADLSLEEMAGLPIEELARILERGTTTEPEPVENAGDESDVEGVFSLERASEILQRIQRLDPPGIGARNLRECLLVQLEFENGDDPAVQLARRVLDETYHEFTMKHYSKICRKLDCTEEELKEANDVITSLNPKPGEGYSGIAGGNYVTPDFVITRSGDDFVITPNDSFIPTIRINSRYRNMLSHNKDRDVTVDKSTRKFLRQKMEAAKWFIASIHQRRETMVKVIRAIVENQFDFFRGGPDFLKPMIYRDIAEKIGMDVSTICRVVNGKYVQTDYGVFELRYFFSEALETAWGEEVSNKVVKSKIRELIEKEDTQSPLSDEALSKRMKSLGYNIARRTVAKYREQMHIPVARLRKSL